LNAEHGQRLVEGVYDTQERPRTLAQNLKHAGQTEHVRVGSNDHARAAGRIRNARFLFCQPMDQVAGKGKLLNRREVYDTYAGVGRDPMFSNGPVELRDRFIRQPPLKPEQKDFVLPSRTRTCIPWPLRVRFRTTLFFVLYVIRGSCGPAHTRPFTLSRTNFF
jgi:hypothetical protein